MFDSPHIHNNIIFNFKHFVHHHHGATDDDILIHHHSTIDYDHKHHVATLDNDDNIDGSTDHKYKQYGPADHSHNNGVTHIDSPSYDDLDGLVGNNPYNH